MIELENTQVVGLEPAIRGMRNPMNSWEKSDSYICNDDEKKCSVCECNHTGQCYDDFVLGSKDHDLMMRLAAGGSVHTKYRRMIVVYVDITAPLYWWKEFDTYKVGTVANSCSTMHKIHAKEFTEEDFSIEHLLHQDDINYPEDFDLCYPENYPDLPVITRCTDAREYTYYFSPFGGLSVTIGLLNKCRELYLKTKDKKYWWQMIQLLPSSYNQKRTVMLNYEVLAGIYPSRKDHKLDEWREFCEWIKELPYSEIITLEDK